MLRPPDDLRSADQSGDPICPACSKPIRSTRLAVVEHGQLFHTLCRTRLTQLLSLELREQSRRTRAQVDAWVARSVLPARRRLIIVLSGPERRQPLTPPEAAMWWDFGFRLVYRVK
jgi:hypothetical protein